MTKWLASMCFLMAFAFPITIFANQNDITFSATITAPKNILVGRTGIAQYQVKNFLDDSLPAEFIANSTAVKVDTSAKNSCVFEDNYFTIPAGNSSTPGQCTLTLDITPTTVTSNLNIPQVVYTEPGPFKQEQNLPDFNVAAVNTLPNSAPTLTVKPSSLVLTPGEKTSLTVTNTSASGGQTVNNLQINIPAPYNKNFSSIDDSQCQFLAPGKSCQINLTVQSNANKIQLPTKDITASIYGANSKEAYADLTFFKGALTANSLNFVAPGTQNMLITNHANVPLSVTGLTLCSSNSTLNGITVSSSEPPASCQSIQPNGTCEYPLTATADAYGQGCANISYTSPAGSQQISNIPVTVANISVLINNNNRIVLGEITGPQSVPLQNTGKFNWINPKLTLEKFAGVTMSSTCQDSIAPGSTCNASFNVSPNVENNEFGILTASGTNLQSSQKNITVEKVSIAVSVEAKNQHLQSQVIKIQNDSTQAVKYNSSTLIPLIRNAANSLSISNTDCKPGQMIQPNSSCSVTIVTNKKTIDSFGIEHIANLQISVGEINASFAVNLNNYLLAVDMGGNFYKFDGNSFEKVMTINKMYDALLYGGDLYIAGDQLQRWNGTEPLFTLTYADKKKGTNPTPLALASFNGKLYVGLSNGHLAVLDSNGSDYSNALKQKYYLTNKINSLYAYGPDLYLLGTVAPRVFSGGNSLSKASFNVQSGVKQMLVSSRIIYAIGNNSNFYTIPSSSILKTLTNFTAMTEDFSNNGIAVANYNNNSTSTPNLHIISNKAVVNSAVVSCSPKSTAPTEITSIVPMSSGYVLTVLCDPDKVALQILDNNLNIQTTITPPLPIISLIAIPQLDISGVTTN